MFKLPSWSVMAGNVIGLFALITGCVLVALGHVSMWWLLPILVGHLWNTLMTSAGLHRYFSHAGFRTSRFWHEVMTWYSPLLLIGSALDWAVLHTQHHVYCDTDDDPHYTGLSYLVWKRYRPSRPLRKRLKRLMQDRSVVLAHRYGLLVWLGVVVGLALISPTVLLYCYLAPLGLTHLIGGIHQVVSHRGGEPRDLPWLEYILPAGGEWNHGTHHKTGRLDLRRAPWHLDPGYLFIRLIRRA